MASAENTSESKSRQSKESNSKSNSIFEEQFPSYLRPKLFETDSQDRKVKLASKEKKEILRALGFSKNDDLTLNKLNSEDIAEAKIQKLLEYVISSIQSMLGVNQKWKIISDENSSSLQGSNDKIDLYRICDTVPDELISYGNIETLAEFKKKKTFNQVSHLKIKIKNKY